MLPLEMNLNSIKSPFLSLIWRQVGHIYWLLGYMITQYSFSCQLWKLNLLVSIYRITNEDFLLVYSKLCDISLIWFVSFRQPHVGKWFVYDKSTFELRCCISSGKNILDNEDLMTFIYWIAFHEKNLTKIWCLNILPYWKD